MKLYTDGSFNKSLTMKATGWAAVLVKMETTETISVDILYGVSTDIDLCKMWNVGGEITAATRGIEYALAKGIDDIDIFYDYRGVEDWANGIWKANKAATQRYQKTIKKFRKDATIRFKKVSAHTGILLNELADLYAKKALTLYLDPNSNNKKEWLEKDFIIDKEHYHGQHFYL